MNKEIREFINRLAEQVISAYKIEIPIKDIKSVVKKMGGQITYKDNFYDLVDGSIKKTGKMSFEIALSILQSEERRNFTIAHELGHLFLHMGFRTNKELWEKQDKIVYQRKERKEYQEYQANEFAAALLMPREKYKEVFDKNTKNNKNTFP